MNRLSASVTFAIGMSVCSASHALLPPPSVECCYRKDYTSEQCARFKLDEAVCVKAVADFNETFKRLQAINNPKPAPASAESNAGSAPEAKTLTEAKEKTFRGKFFEVRYPAAFVARPLTAPREADSDAATFTSPDQSVVFYVYSPQWAGEAPGMALDANTEIEVERRSGKGRSSDIEGHFTWTSIAAKDKKYTRSYQRFDATDKSICWVIGLQYTSAEALKRHQAEYTRFKASLVQMAD